ncbi:Translocon-associated protein subunit alpha [Tetrabaena socialis]|uniref:Translocon-associated protein subunit alpha n=1 Tax=Tetrabaena socialis TaxID=47790 RepID=A0A2J7ZWD4_9CHLO|nr:Translocon-associated protein subunit alpha [Tetrabaena socialis]|eukprot:PNH04580.1 Translocon-associated protein subunit alpha [Tetrabaena socialis]
MGSVSRRGAVLLAACLAFGAFAAAQETPRSHPLTNLPASGEIATGVFFPDYPLSRHFPAGQPVKVVLGVHNDASEPYNVSAIMGSLNNAQQFGTYYWNFTQQLYFQIVEPSKELSVEYTFLPPKDLPPNDYQVALTVFYEAADGFKSTTFFNQTVTVIEMKQLIDWKLIFLYAIFIGLVFVGVFYVWSTVKDYPLYKTIFGKKTRKVEVSNADNDDDWVKGTPYDNFRKKKAAGGKATVKKAQ